jgi:hypothetical protein
MLYPGEGKRGQPAIIETEQFSIYLDNSERRHLIDVGRISTKIIHKLPQRLSV